MLPTITLGRASRSRMSRFWQRFYASCSQMNWDALALMTLTHMLASYLLLRIAGETDLHSGLTFLYFYVVTSSTVGYGDFSPTTFWGQWIVVAWMIPGGIMIFTALVGKAVSSMVEQWRRTLSGSRDYSDWENHIVIVGWRGVTSQKLVEQIRGDTSDTRDILVLGVVDQNPLPDHVTYVRAKSLNDLEAMHRAGISSASTIIVTAESDSSTLGAALCVEKLLAEESKKATARSRGHVVAYFVEEDAGKILSSHYPHIETVISISVEQTVQAAQDPGSSEVIRHLMSNLEGETQFRIVVPDGVDPMRAGDVLAYLRMNKRATLIGHRCGSSEALKLNPDDDLPVVSGDSLYVIAAKRICGADLDWSAVCPS